MQRIHLVSCHQIWHKMVISVNQGQILKTPADVGLMINSFTQK